MMFRDVTDDPGSDSLTDNRAPYTLREKKGMTPREVLRCFKQPYDLVI